MSALLFIPQIFYFSPVEGGILFPANSPRLASLRWYAVQMQERRLPLQDYDSSGILLADNHFVEKGGASKTLHKHAYLTALSYIKRGLAALWSCAASCTSTVTGRTSVSSVSDAVLS
ncbi:uncharacterized protein FOMMEDRAFT_150348 [Fomitiporia mediterranea MF3/22]|uniref:uncharacterized protein n=1 Tax=Fomitiporia mediterranea (strain MF3/22) TaxID=694068 RepID=UPI0004409562|nr:uncharacterized protein FOMMEDRAFT_150348 [Fomitiporia mediterranea MF3/22]EJD07797.1 hypothetical protein FOMMEDRAFT_150348 [Fomitiporia mediterranea MF3/22]